MFGRALCYPCIEIQDECWLKSALLYWDEVRTIVPAEITDPYRNPTSREFAAEGVLLAEMVDPTHTAVEQASQAAIKFRRSAEWRTCVATASAESESSSRQPETLLWAAARRVGFHPMKLAPGLRRELEAAGIVREGQNAWLHADAAFTKYYMSLLAERISAHAGLDLLAVDSISSAVGIKSRVDGWQRAVRAPHEGPPQRRLAEGLIVTLLMERVSVLPDTSPSKILEFRAKHRPELLALRAAVESLANTVDGEFESGDALFARCREVCARSVKPAVTDLKRSLSGLAIDWVTDNAVQVVTVNASSTAAVVLCGLGAPQAAALAGGVTILTSAVRLARERRETVRNSPYAYLMRAEERWPGIRRNRPIA